MQCDYCDSKATVFFTQIIDGVSKKSCLCEKCAIENGVTDPEGFLLDDIPPVSASSQSASAADGKTFGETHIAAVQPSAKVAADQLCPGCGFAFDDLKQIGRLGCSQCYQFFREEIKVNLGVMHKDINHVGRVPEGMLEVFEYRKQLEELKQKMETAITEENYEKAAALRDEMQQLSDPRAEDTAVKQSET